MGHHLVVATNIVSKFHTCAGPFTKMVRLPSQGGQGAPPWLVLDGAHTPESCAALVETIRAVLPGPAPVALVVAMASDKDHDGCLQVCFYV